MVNTMKKWFLIVLVVALLVFSRPDLLRTQSSVGGGTNVTITGQPISVTVSTEPSVDPCASPSIAKTSAFQNITTATTTALVPPSGSTVVYVCGVLVQLNSTTASTVLFEYGTGAACATAPTSLTSTFTNSTLVSEAISYGGSGQTIFKTPASNGFCAVTTVGTSPTIPVTITFVQQ